MRNMKSVRLLVASCGVLCLVFLAALSSALSSSGQELATSKAFAYVSNRGNGTVSVINTSSGAVVATVNLPTCVEDCTDSPAGLAVTPNGKFVYVAVTNQQYVAVIDTATNTVSTTIPLTCPGDCGAQPFDVAITPDGSYVYVTDAGTVGGTGAVYVIRTSDYSVTTITGTGDGPYVGSYAQGIAIDPTGTFAYVGHSDCGEECVSDTISIITIATNTVTGSIPVGNAPTGVAFSPTAKVAYVTNEDDGTISIINTSTNTVTDTITLPHCNNEASPYFVAFTPDGASAYVTDEEGCGTSVMVINTASPHSTPVTVSTDSTPVQVAISPDGSAAYVVISNDDAVFAISTATNTLSETGIPVGGSPFGIAIGPGTGSVTAGGGTITFPFYDGGASISFTFPPNWCSATVAPCTVTAVAEDEPDSVWQSTDSSNYPHTDIAPASALPGGGGTGGDGFIVTAKCTDKNGNVCSGNGNLEYTTTMVWNTETDICGTGSGPALGKEETTTWENILATCTFLYDPSGTTSGSSKDGLSRWASFYNVSGSPVSNVSIITPANGGFYLLNQPVNASYSCSPSSALFECVGTVPNSSPIDTSSTGTKSFTATADVTSGPTSSKTVNYNVIPCHDVSILFNPSTVRVGGFTIVNAIITSCTHAVEKKTTVQFILTGPFGRACGTSQTVMFTTPPFTLDTDVDSFKFPILIPFGACAGTYTVTANTFVAGTLVDSSSSALTVTAH
jgi:YVTN family beta-propeller protein